MNKQFAIAAVVGSFGLYAMHGSSKAAREPELRPHPHSMARFEGCAALAEAGLDDDTANSLVSARSPASAGQVNVSMGMDLLAGKDGSDDHKKVTQSAQNVAMSNLVCAAASKGVSFRFGHTWFSRRLSTFSVSRNGVTKSGTIERIGSGLDGEPRLAFNSFGSLGTLDADESDALPLCLITSKRDIGLTSGISSFLEGSLVGLVMQSGGEFDRKFTSTCHLVLADFGEERAR